MPNESFYFSLRTSIVAGRWEHTSLIHSSIWETEASQQADFCEFKDRLISEQVPGQSELLHRGNPSRKHRTPKQIKNNKKQKSKQKTKKQMLFLLDITQLNFLEYAFYFRSMREQAVFKKQMFDDSFFPLERLCYTTDDNQEVTPVL